MRSSYSRLLSIARIVPRKRLTSTTEGHLRNEVLFARVLARRTGDPLWALVEKLRRPQNTLPLSEALFKNGLSSEAYEGWRRVIEASNIDHAMSIIVDMKPLATHSPHYMDEYVSEIDSYDTEPPLETRPLPPWLVAYMACYQVRTPAQANGALLNLVFNQLPTTPAHLQPSLLVLVALSLAKYALLAPMKRVLDVFLTIPVDQPTLHFNLLVQAIARLPKSPESANLAVKMLEAMTSRSILLSSRTYHTLLADRFVTLQLTKLLQTKMVQENFTPSAAHLESFVRVFAKNGLIHDAGKYLEAMRTHGAKQGNPNVPYGPILDEDNGIGVPHPANTSYLAAIGKDPTSAFQYLGRLLDRSEKLEAEKQAKPTLPHISLRQQRSTKKSIDIFDWTMLFSRLARNKNTTSDQLLQLFDEAPRSPRFRPTAATYTVLLWGLIERKKYDEAIGVWERLLDDGIIIDRKALGAGVYALTLAGDPLRAFSTLEAYAAKPAAPSSTNQEARARLRSHILKRSEQRPIQIDITTINHFITGLLRAHRPDVAFKLWDHMTMLYNVAPNDHTLERLCRGARLAWKLDAQSLAGSIAMMGLRNPFRKPLLEPTSREEVINMVGGMLNEGNRRVVRSMWNNIPAFDVVRQVFHTTILGNYPHLRNIRAPAHAVRKPDSNDGPFAPLTEVAQSIAQSFSSKEIQTIEPSPPRLDPLLLTTAPTSSYSTIIPSEGTFYEYILLLGTSSYQHEIPLVLAWMRALDIQPRSRTLAVSLIFWAEVSLRGPLFEDWASRRDRSEYGKLKMWMHDWVGDGVPHDGIIAGHLKKVAAARDSRPPQRGKRMQSGRVIVADL